MKGAFIIDHPFDIHKPSGVDRKIIAQIRAFNNAGLTCVPIVIDGQERRDESGDLLNAIKRRLPYINQDPRWIYLEAFDGLDFIYFRKPSYLTHHLRKVLAQLRAHNPCIRIVMEIPTYPYDAEYKPLWREFPFLLKDRFNRMFLKDLLSRVVVISDDEHQKVFNVKAIRIINGIDVESIPMMQPHPNKTIDLIAVAQFAQWHGYDRLLKGLVEYYRNNGKRDIIIHLVGEGPEITAYKDIARNELIRNRVVFYGRLYGDALNDVYNVSDFGVTSLGCFRKGIKSTSELKSREYLLKGLPIISGCPIDVLEKQDFDYCLEFPNDESPIDFEKIVAFYDHLHTHEVPQEIAERIRTFAEINININATMLPVIEFLKQA